MKTGLTRRRWIALSAAIACLPPRPGGAAPPRTEFTQHTADEAGFYANTYLFEGERACFLVDAHLNAAEAEQAAMLVSQTGKPLTAILITHPHPDHILGLEVLGPRFPDAQILGAPGTLGYVREIARAWTGFGNRFVPLSDGPITIADHDFACLRLPDAESPSPIVLYDPAHRALVAGDHVLNGQHHWLVEGRGEAWRENLSTLRETWRIDQVLPGHGPVGGPEIIDLSDAYIALFLRLRAKGTPPEQARSAMLEAFPGFVFAPALDASINANF